MPAIWIFKGEPVYISVRLATRVQHDDGKLVIAEPLRLRLRLIKKLGSAMRQLVMRLLMLVIATNSPRARRRHALGAALGASPDQRF